MIRWLRSEIRAGELGSDLTWLAIMLAGGSAAAWVWITAL
jgi:hypothetical protein